MPVYAPLMILLLIVVTPLIELYLLLKIGAAVGALPTLLLTIATAIIGAYLVRAQGLPVLMRVRALMARGELPAFELADGALLLLSGLALLLPGFLTDALGFALLVPALRRFVLKHVFAIAPPRIGATRAILDGDYRRE